MSQWTHVAGIIRIDDMRMLPMAEHPRDYMGNTCDYDDDEYTWDECDVPKGSEGSLEYSIFENPMHNHLSAYSVQIFGDLRDYNDLKEIEEYLNKITSGRMVRQGVVTVDIEREKTYIITHSDGKWTTTEVEQKDNNDD